MRTLVGRVALELCKQEGEKDPILACQQLIGGVLDDCNVDVWPVDLGSIAEYLEIEVVYDNHLGSPGYLVGQPPNLSIVLNGSDHRVKQRFTLGHEITHAILPGSDPNRRSVSERNPFAVPRTVEQEEEYLCDQGAALLLFPPRLLTVWAETSSGGTDFSAIERLGQDFDASLQASAIAIVHSTSAPLQVVGWKHIDKGIVRPYQMSANTSFPDGLRLPWDYRINSNRQLFRFIETGERGSNMNEFSMKVNGKREIFYSEHRRTPNHPILSMISLLRPRPAAPKFAWENDHPIKWLITK